MEYQLSEMHTEMVKYIRLDIEEKIVNMGFDVDEYLNGFKLKSLSMSFFKWMCVNGHLKPIKPPYHRNVGYGYFGYIDKSMYKKLANLYALYRVDKQKSK